MSLEKDVVYSVIANGNTNLGFVLNDKFYGSHYSEHGPIHVEEMEGFEFDGTTFRRLKDGERFRLVEVTQG